MRREDMKVVCLGDSITWGFPYGHYYSWVRMLADVHPGEFINQGINGNTTTEMLYRFDQAVLKYHPSHVIIMGGINDVFCQDSFDRITLNLKRMAEKASVHGIKVILGTPTAVDYPAEEKLLLRIRHWIKDYAREQNHRVIDFAAAFYDETGRVRSDLLLADGGHPTQAGYDEIFKQIDLEVFDAQNGGEPTN